MNQLEMWLDLETLIQSEVSQKEENKYCIWTCICGIWKSWYRRPHLWGRNRDTDVEIKRMDTKGDKGRWGGMNWETGIDIYAYIGTMSEIDSRWEFPV